MQPGIYVIGVATHPPAERHDGYRLEELVYHTSRAALDDAEITRRELDSVTLGASDELDGRPISSMLLATPAGAFLTDETRVTDSGATALCLAVARMLSGDFHIGLVASWCKTSKTDVDSVANAGAEPFYTRPLGMSATLAEGLFAQAVTNRFELDPDEVSGRVAGAYGRAAANPRGMRHPVPSATELEASEYEATPLRTGHRAPLSDGAASLVVASESWLRTHPGHRVLARIAGVGWATDSYRLDASRLREFGSAQSAWSMALAQAGVPDPSELDLVELDTPSGFHEAAYSRVFELADEQVSPSGGTFAQNPLFCSGLVNVVEAVLQLSGRAGGVQRERARRAVAHSCHGFAQQGNVAIVLEGEGASRA
jgi:acetyl-CoA acetyltransferase